MAELKSPQEPTFPSKRKTEDPNPQDPPNKAPKLATLDNNNNNNNEQQEPNKNSEYHTDFSQPGNDVVQEEVGNGGNELQNDAVDGKVEANDDDGDDDDDDDDAEESNGEAEVDRKGKGVLRDDKGKGKLIEEEEEEDGDDEDDDDDDDDDSDDDSDEDGNVSGADSDFSDDPLAEVDLNNILPSRTRRRTAQRGLHIAGDAGNVPANDDDDNDNDSDA